MTEHFRQINTNKVDTKEFEIPETVFERDIDDQVFQGIVLNCLSKIEGIALPAGRFIDSIIGRTKDEGLSAITINQDNRNHSVTIRIEINVFYGVSIPEKAEEIQTIVTDEVTTTTGLHVGLVHVVFKNVVSSSGEKGLHELAPSLAAPMATTASIEDEYNDEF